MPPGRANTKYEPKNANWISAASTLLSANTDFRCGIRMSFRLVRKPHIKNSAVATVIARWSVVAREGALYAPGPAEIAI